MADQEHKKKKKVADKEETKEKKTEKTADQEDEAPARLAQLRPKQRFIFLLAFLAFNIWFVLVYNPCISAAKKKTREECGWPGVTQFSCITQACFLMPGTAEKFNVQVNVPKDKKELGMKVQFDGGRAWVTAILPTGAVALHNENQSAQRIQAGDQIVRVNGHVGDNIRAELSRKKATAKFELARPSFIVAKNVPAWLGEYAIGKVLRSSGFERWAEAFSRVAGVGVFAWFLSGYPVASLPIYYLGVSAASSWYMVRCCHQEKPGLAHCFSHSIKDVPSALELAWNQTTAKRAKSAFGWLP